MLAIVSTRTIYYSYQFGSLLSKVDDGAQVIGLREEAHIGKGPLALGNFFL